MANDSTNCLGNVLAPGQLTIVVQGSVYDWNLVSTALNCHHWRTNFPDAEIVFAIALSDVLVLNRESQVALIDKFHGNGEFSIALSTLQKACDKIVFSEGALPLPPLKFDGKANNVNLQIAAAKQGLDVATGIFVLRIRSDLVFRNRDWLRYYSDNYDLPRSEPKLFQQRVMISSMFTLNPFGLERLPFHFSDWFHFGLLSDVRSIWDIPYYNLADAIYYETEPHVPPSNWEERQFRSRLAAEQHIHFSAISKSRKDLVLRWHNDQESSLASAAVLANEFLVAGQRDCGFSLHKYSSFDAHHLSLLCVSSAEWKALVLTKTYQGSTDSPLNKAKKIRKFLLIEREPSFRAARGILRLIGRLKMGLLNAALVVKVLVGLA